MCFFVCFNFCNAIDVQIMNINIEIKYQSEVMLTLADFKQKYSIFNNKKEKISVHMRQRRWSIQKIQKVLFKNPDKYRRVSIIHFNILENKKKKKIFVHHKFVVCKDEKAKCALIFQNARNIRHKPIQTNKH